jgi:hypothetical protein
MLISYTAPVPGPLPRHVLHLISMVWRVGWRRQGTVLVKPLVIVGVGERERQHLTRDRSGTVTVGWHRRGQRARSREGSDPLWWRGTGLWLAGLERLWGEVGWWCSSLGLGLLSQGVLALFDSASHLAFGPSSCTNQVSFTHRQEHCEDAGHRINLRFME